MLWLIHHLSDMHSPQVPATLPHNFSLFDFPFNGIQYLNQMGVPWCIQSPLVNDHIPDEHAFRTYQNHYIPYYISILCPLWLVVPEYYGDISIGYRGPITIIPQPIIFMMVIIIVG